jgi:ABC-type branched-subunit amino acid transport system ATPase component
VSSGYKQAIVIRNISFSIESGQAVAMLGKNGMGKSTLLKTIMGYLPARHGSVHLNGIDTTKLSPFRIAGLGIAYAAQEKSLFQDLSIYDNLRLAVASDAIFAERFLQVAELFPVFKARLKQAAGTLSGGEQKMLLIARALLMRPSVVLLDEITEGLQPSVIDRIAEALLWERQARKTTMLIVEQNVNFALRVADSYLLIKQGDIVNQGDSGCEQAKKSVLEHLKI